MLNVWFVKWSCDLPRIFNSFSPSSIRRGVSVLPVIALLCVSGCGVGDFISAYFNTYYNARRLFTEAEKEVLTPSDPRRVDTTYLAPFQVSAASKTKFTSVIEKCSKLLLYHPGSNLVDDALMMIGKSYYYQNDNQQAERKFKEILDAYPQSEFVLEARLLLGSIYYKLNDKQTAASTARELIAAAEKEDEPAYIARGALLLAYIEADNKSYAAARGFFQTVAEKGETDAERISAYMRVAEMHVREAGYDEALEAYRLAERLSSSYVSEYRARLGQARMLSRLARYEASIDVLEDLLDDTNNKEFFGEISLEIANTYAAMGNTAHAIAQYVYVDTTYARTEAAANGYYQLGLLYEMKLRNYDSARVAYNKGRTEFPSAAVTPLLVQRGDYLNRHLSFVKEITKYDSIKVVLLAPPGTTQLFALPDSINLSGQDTTSADSLFAASTLQDDSIRASGQNVPPAPAIPLDTVQARLAFNKSELASLFYSGIGVLDSAEYWYRRLLIEHPVCEHIPRAIFTLAQIRNQDSTQPRTGIDSLYREIVGRYPDSEFATEARRQLGLAQVKQKSDPAESAYSTAGMLMASGNSAAAIDSFKSLVLTYPESPLASKAQYAIGWIYEQNGAMSDSAISNYQQLVAKYPGSQYAIVVKGKLEEVERARKALEQPTVEEPAHKDEPIPSKDGVQGHPSDKKQFPPDDQPKDEPQPSDEGQDSTKPEKPKP